MPPRPFKALVVYEAEKNTFTRRIEECDTSRLPENEVLIQVKYSSLNYKDALSATGNRGVTRSYPHTPGIDAAGTVIESSNSGLTPGDDVIVTGYDLGMNTHGGFGQYIRVPPEWVIRLPKGLTLRQSMIYGTAGFTAAQSVLRLIDYGITPEQGTVLVTGATGGVGSIAVSLLAKSGFQVIAATGKADQKSFLTGLGAAEVISREETSDTSDRALLRGRWAGVVDTVGGNTLSTVIKSTGYRGAVTTCGNVSSGDLHTTVYPFILRGISLLGIDSANCPHGIRLHLWEKLSQEWKLEKIDQLATEIPLADLSNHIDLILQGKLKGRTIVNMQNV